MSNDKFTFTEADIQDVKDEICELTWTYVRFDIAEYLINSGEYRRYNETNQNSPMNFIPLTKNVQ